MRIIAIFLTSLAVCASAVRPVAALENLNRYIFIPARASTDITVIDMATDTVAIKIPIGHVPKQVAISKTLNYLIATNDANATMSVFELSTLKKIATIQLSVRPDRLLINPDGDLIAVADVTSGAISQVSLRKLGEVSRISGLRQPNTMFFSRDGKLLYVGNETADHISVIDVAAGKVANKILVADPKMLNGHKEYRGIIAVTSTPYAWAGFASFGLGDEMAIIDLRSNKRVKTLKLGGTVGRAYSTQDGAFMIVPNNGDQTVSLISLFTLTEVARLPGARDMVDVGTGYLETLAFVISRAESKVLVIDLVNRTKIGEIALPTSPEAGATSPDGAKLYVAVSGTDQVAVIDIVQRKLVKLINNVGRKPWAALAAGRLAFCH